MSVFIAHRRKNASNALNVTSTDKETSSVYDENSRFACPAHANCYGTSSMSLVQRQRRCDGHTYRSETVEHTICRYLVSAQKRQLASLVYHTQPFSDDYD